MNEGVNGIPWKSYPVTEIQKAWQRAAKDLGIEVEIPFSLGGESWDAELLVKEFGSPKGTVVLARSSENLKAKFEVAKRMGFFVSAVATNSYDRESFVDTLNDWGYFGDPDSVPHWYSRKPWTR